MHPLFAHYLGLVGEAERQLAESLRVVAGRHANVFDVRQNCTQLADWSYNHVETLQPFFERYGRENVSAPQQLRASLFHGGRLGDFGLLQDLQDLSLLANSVRTDYTILQQGAIALEDMALAETASTFGDQTNRQIEWLCTRIKETSPQVLTVPPNLADEAKAALPKTAR